MTSSWRGVTFCEMTHEERGETKVRGEAKCWSGEIKNSSEFANASSCSVGILADFVVRRLVLRASEAGFCSEVRCFWSNSDLASAFLVEAGSGSLIVIVEFSIKDVEAPKLLISDS